MDPFSAKGSHCPATPWGHFCSRRDGAELSRTRSTPGPRPGALPGSLVAGTTASQLRNRVRHRLSEGARVGEGVWGLKGTWEGDQPPPAGPGGARGVLE